MPKSIMMQQTLLTDSSGSYRYMVFPIPEGNWRLKGVSVGSANARMPDTAFVTVEIAIQGSDFQIDITPVTPIYQNQSTICENFDIQIDEKYIVRIKVQRADSEFLVYGYVYLEESK